jgi:hypothetical protein
MLTYSWACLRAPFGCLGHATLVTAWSHVRHSQIYQCSRCLRCQRNTGPLQHLVKNWLWCWPHLESDASFSVSPGVHMLALETDHEIRGRCTFHGPYRMSRRETIHPMAREDARLERIRQSLPRSSIVDRNLSENRILVKFLLRRSRLRRRQNGVQLILIRLV